MRLYVLLLGLLTASCGGEPLTPSQPASSLERSFVEAARAYQVPEGILKSVAWVETRVSMTPGEASAMGAWGLMQLRGQRLDRAAQLTGVQPGLLKVDAHANVMGAAAVLREVFDTLKRDDASLDAHEVGDWYRAVALYPDFDGALDANAWAAQVFMALEQGFTTRGEVNQPPLACSWRRHAPVAVTRQGLDYSGAATFVQSPNYTAGRSAYEFIIVHTMQGSYSGSRAWFLNTASKVSAHYLVRSTDGEITQMVAHADTAWHVQCYNARSIGIEHEGYAAAPAMWFTEAMYTESAKLARYIADRHSIPKDRAHLLAHAEVPSTCNTNGHTDPGSGWNWTKYMQLVTGQVNPGTGVLTGAIYTNGSVTNRVAGAVVTVNGTSVTTGTDGLYQFTLMPGSYTASVTKTGFAGAQVTRAVSMGTTTWGSMEINATSVANGTLSGTVVAAGTGQPIEGATVTVNGAMQMTPATGAFSFSLPAGTYTVSATKPGAVQAQATQAVASGQTATVTLTLAQATGADATPPVVTVSEPATRAMLDLAVVQVKGAATDDRGPVTSVSLSLNGAAALDVPVTNGLFSVQVQLSPGANGLTLTAHDAANNVGTASLTASFSPGVRGTVHLAGAETPISGAKVELRDSSTGSVVATATTNSTGAYFVAAPNVPADYVINARAQGHITASETVTVPDDAQVVLPIALTPGEDIVDRPAVAFSEPGNGETLTTDTVTVYGTVRGFVPTSVTVNKLEAQLLTGGAFTLSVPLTVGSNVLEAVGHGAAGESASATVQVTRRAGANVGLDAVVGSCATTPGLAVIAALALLLRRGRAGQARV